MREVDTEQLRARVNALILKLNGLGPLTPDYNAVKAKLIHDLAVQLLDNISKYIKFNEGKRSGIESMKGKGEEEK